MSDPQPTVIFLHIPRTGGTTLDKLPERNYSSNQILNVYDSDRDQQINQFANLSESRRANYKCVKGHLFFGFHKLVPGPSNYITFLREPIGRVLSFYSYARVHPDHYLHQLVVQERLDLKELLRRRVTDELFNLQTRMIAGGLENPDQAVDRSALERAKENLRTYFPVVGLTEAFDASMLLLTRRYGWRLPLYRRRNARRGAPETVDAQTRNLLREANALDLELYQFAQELFDAQLRNAGQPFQADLRRFQRLNFWCARSEELFSNLRTSFRRMIDDRGKTSVVSEANQTGTDTKV